MAAEVVALGGPLVGVDEAPEVGPVLGGVVVEEGGGGGAEVGELAGVVDLPFSQRAKRGALVALDDVGTLTHRVTRRFVQANPFRLFPLDLTV